MIEKGFESREKFAANRLRLERAEDNIRNKTLWMVPNWDCNRAKNPCGICFATDIMKDAKTNGYQHADSDYFAKTRILSRLPWKEVVITGGEPTSDTELLRKTLFSIDPYKKIRIITNGDWILNEEKKEEIISLINSSHYPVQIDISTHDEWGVLLQKIIGIDNKLSVGVQLRFREVKKHAPVKGVGFARYLEKFERHEVVRLGNAKQQNAEGSVLMGLEKLISYSRNRNQGIYLISGKGGARVIANHEAPYLVSRTPADLVDPEDDTQIVFNKVVAFYANYDNFVKKPASDLNLDAEALGYLKPAFKIGVPIDIYSSFYTAKHSEDLREESIVQRKELINVYYQSLSENSKKPISEIKNLIAKRIAFKILEIDSHIWERCYSTLKFDSLSLTRKIARNAPRGPSSLAHKIADELFPWEKPDLTDDKDSTLSIKNNHENPYGVFKREFFDAYPGDLNDFRDHLRILDISEDSIAQELKQLTSGSKN